MTAAQVNRVVVQSLERNYPNTQVNRVAVQTLVRSVPSLQVNRVVVQVLLKREPIHRGVASTVQRGGRQHRAEYRA